MSVLRLWERLGRVEQAFLVLLLVFGVLEVSQAGLAVRLGLAAVLAVLGVYVAGQITRRILRRVIWRLRNRLIVAFLFIAVVPILLIATLVGWAARDLAGQIGVYLVHSEFERRITNLRNAAQALLRTPAPQRAPAMPRLGALFRERFPGLEVLVLSRTGPLRFPAGSRLASPPEGWGEASGVLAMDGMLYQWARAVDEETAVTAVAPVTRRSLAELVAGLGEVTIVQFQDPTSTSPAAGRRMRVHGALPGESPPVHSGIPAPANRFDLEFRWATNIPVAVWESPESTANALLGVHSRISAVLRVISSQKAEWGPLLLALYTIAGILLLVEIVSAIVGVSITRSVTGAVHDLYEGTLRVQSGDFAHRIGVRGGDQIAELSRSFNQMTESLEKLLLVAKEKERLQADLEIAREVQSQLYPRAAPALERLQLRAVCQPARMVSGDYYDYQSLDDSKVALAIGDVAGKGISAALLMATLQSSLRTQLRACLDRAAAAGNGGAGELVSTSRLVTQINQHLYANTAPEKYATFLLAVFDDRTGALTYTNAGHLPPLLLRDGRVIPLEVNGMVVGAFPFASYGESRVDLQSGDLLVCYSDGITEPENEYSEMFGEARLIELIFKHAHRAPEEIASAVIDGVHSFTGSPELQDDMTLLLARRL